MGKYTLPPRQKMINLLYVILIAMLAINISADVLEGYKLLNKESAVRFQKAVAYNDSLRTRVMTMFSDSTRLVAKRLDSLSVDCRGMLAQLREEIAAQADKEKYVPGKLSAADDLNAVPRVMLSATDGKGDLLREKLSAFKEHALACISDSTRRDYAESFLPLESFTRGMSWERELFSYLPAIGGFVALDRLEQDVLALEAEVYNSMMHDRESDGYRYVIINEGQRVVNSDGTVDLPAVTMSPVGGMTLYRNFQNKLSLFCAGIPLNDLRVTISDGSIRRNGDYYVAVPGKSKEVTIAVYSNRNGGQQPLYSMKCHVKALPNPTPYIAYKKGGAVLKYYGNVPIRKEDLRNAVSLGANLSEGLEVAYSVQSFEMVVIGAGNNVESLRSSNGQFTEAQKQRFRSLSRGDKCYITSIIVKCATGVEQTAPINVVVM